jgi:hypothetical protein
MAAIATILGGIALGGAAFGGLLVAVDPLKARTPPLAPADDGDPQFAANALAMLGYSGESGTAHFQEDVNQTREWHRALSEGNERQPPNEIGYTHVPAALQRMTPGPDLAVNNTLDAPTRDAVVEAVEAVVFAAGTECVTEAGQSIEADAHSCLDAWRHAYTYAEAANAASTSIVTMSATVAPTDEWGQPAANAAQSEGQHGPFLWRSYKDNTGQFNQLYYFVTWRNGYEPAQGPFQTAAAAEAGAAAYMAGQLNGNGNGGTSFDVAG